MRSNRRLYFDNNKIDVEEVPYQKGKTGSIKVHLSSAAYDFIGTSPFDFDKGVYLDDVNAGSIKTYNTIVINDYEWMSDNLCVYHANRMATQLSWMNFTKEVIDKMNQSYQGKDNVSLEHFYKINGSYFSNYDTDQSYRNGYKVYSLDGRQVQGWRLPDYTDIQTMIGYAPRNGKDLNFSIKDFMFANSAYVGSDYIGEWFNYSNSSGLNLTPLGGRHSGELGENGQTYYAYKEQCNLRTSVSDEHQFIFSLSKGVQSASKLYHLGQVRYCRQLSNEELGYKICQDRSLNRLVCLEPNEKTSLPELGLGYFRGIAYRYFDKKTKSFLISFSDIEKIVRSEYLNFIKSY